MVPALARSAWPAKTGADGLDTSKIWNALVVRALKDRLRRVRHIEDVEAFASRSADSDVGVVALDVDRRLVERREIALTYAYRNCRVRYVEYLEAIGVAASLDNVGVL